jgi:hypothetical protein
MTSQLVHPPLGAKQAVLSMRIINMTRLARRSLFFAIGLAAIAPVVAGFAGGSSAVEYFIPTAFPSLPSA